jgi:competence ComEA-like helix-hairpin-helix protein
VPTPSERKALWFLAFVALSGSAVRAWRSQAAAPPATDSAALARQIQRVDSARDARTDRPRGSRARAAPKPETTQLSEPVDLDRATAEDIERLPGIGPALAQRIVGNRDSIGPFGDMEALCDVRGIGPALAKRLRPLVTFTGTRRPVSGACGAPSKTPEKTRAPRHSQPR